MSRQERCVLSTDEAGRVLDRLAGLEQVIPPDLVRQVLADCDRVDTRDCVLTFEVTCWLVLALGLFTEVALEKVFKYARRWHGLECRPKRSALCQARQRLGVAPLRQLFGRVVRPLATPDGTPAAFYRGLRKMALDGTVLDVPDTDKNSDTFGRSSAGATRGDGAFPQVRKLSLVEVGTPGEVAFALQGVGAAGGEQALVEELLPQVPPDSLLLEDRGFFSYELWQRTTAGGLKVLARVSSTLTLQPLRHLSDGSYLAQIYPSSAARALDRDGIVVRVIRYTLDDPERPGHGEVHRLITNLLEEQAYPAAELIVGYHWRWEEELVFDEQKTHQDPRRASKPTHLRSGTPAGVEQEMYALSLGHFVVRALMVAAAVQAGVEPIQLSFTGCFQILKCRLPEALGRTRAQLQQWLADLLVELGTERLPPRENRSNPRVVKRKMSKFKKKRAEHRHRPPLTKTFEETVLVLR